MAPAVCSIEAIAQVFPNQRTMSTNNVLVSLLKFRLRFSYRCAWVRSHSNAIKIKFWLRTDRLTVYCLTMLHHREHNNHPGTTRVYGQWPSPWRDSQSITAVVHFPSFYGPKLKPDVSVSFR